MKNSIAEVQAVQQAVKEVEFHGQKLYLVEHQGLPHTPMKQIVENMGLDWKSQYNKLKEYGKRFCVVEITMQMPGDDQSRKVTCIPVRKVFGWLNTIHPGKIIKRDKEAQSRIRKMVEIYQDECDDVLGSYWTEGVAVNPRFLTPEQQRLVQQAVARKVQRLPKDQQRQGYATEYRRIKDAYLVGSYTQLPTDKFDDLMQFIDAEFVAPQPPVTKVTDEQLKAYMQERLGCTKEELKIDGKPLNYDTLHAFFNGSADPIRRHYQRLEQLGVDIEGIKFINCFKDTLLTHYWTMLTEMRLWLSLNGSQKTIEMGSVY